MATSYHDHQLTNEETNSLWKGKRVKLASCCLCEDMIKCGGCGCDGALCLAIRNGKTDFERARTLMDQVFEVDTAFPLQWDLSDRPKGRKTTMEMMHRSERVL